MRSQLVNCLICNTYLSHHQSSEEFTNESDDDNEVNYVDSKKCLQFKLGLQLFSKLLNVEGFEGGDGGIVSSRFPPCCEECGVVFEEMLRLQRAIEELQVSLMKQVDKLKDALIKSDNQQDPLKLPDDLSYLLQLRNQLLSCVRSNSSLSSPISHLERNRHRPHRKKRRRPTSPPSPAHPTPPPHKPSKLPKEYQPCSVILERLSSHQLNSFLQPIQKTTEDNSLSTKNFSTDNLSCRSTRKSKLKAIQFIIEQTSSSTITSKYQSHQEEEDQDLDDFVASPKETGSDQDPNYNNDDNDDDYPWESEAPPEPCSPPPEQKYSPLTLSLQKLSKPSKKFYLITPDLLLYQYTLIKVTQGYTMFTCQSPDCPSPIFSDPSLHWKNLFYLIAHHIETTHENDQQSDPLTLPQKCPLCPLTFPPGRPFRSHLINPTGSKLSRKDHHDIETVVCDICWRPLRNVADFYRAHQWHHKNSQEKDDTPGGPPPKIIYNAKRTLSTKLYKKQKNKKCQDPTILEAISLLNKWNSGKWSKVESKVETVKKVKRKKRPRTASRLTVFKVKKVKPSKPPKIPTKKIKSEVPFEECHLVSTPPPQGSSKFLLLSPTTLLYQYTLIKVSSGFSQLTCQEPNCSSPDYFTNDPLNWRSLFDQVAMHIEAVHYMLNPHASLPNVRECPLCSKQLKGSWKHWRRHFTTTAGEGHGLNIVICQICLKPMKDVADFYRSHHWYHKNTQERKDCVEGPPPKIRFAEKQKLMKKQGYLGTGTTGGNQGQTTKVKVKKMVPPPPMPKSTAKPSDLLAPQQKINSFTKFLIISADFLFYQYTLIKVTQSFTLFTCQENRCPSPEFFTNELSNWKDLFTQIATHIESTHGNPLEMGVRECPYCSRVLEGSAKNFRRHLTHGYSEGHWIRNVICQVCLMPLRNLKDFYRCHQWSHKNKEERDLAEGEDEGPPPNLEVFENQTQKFLAAPIPSFNCVRRRRREPADGSLNKFWVINDTNLLYKYTLISVAQGYTHFTCRESHCPKPNFFTDELSNWRELLEQIAGHVDSNHWDQNREDVRECVLCESELEGSGRDFRRHLTRDFLEGHSVKYVICDICLKPIKNAADFYRCHQWSHKNKEEKLECPGGPPPKIKNAKYYKNKRMKISKGKDKHLSLSASPPMPISRYDKLCLNFARIGRDQEDNFKCLLLHKYTLLEALYGVSLTCQEAECHHVINGTDITAFEEFKNHVFNCHSGNFEEDKVCPLCSQMFGSGSKLRRHLLEDRHEAECRFICTTCWKPFKQVKQMKIHEWSHKNEVERENCTDQDKPPENILKYLKMKESENKFVCGVCGKECRSRTGLRGHLQTHLPREQRKLYKCPQCPKTFLEAVGVRGHVERVHQRELLRWRVCPICSKKYNWRDGYKFRTHVRSHKDERNWICDKCGMGFLNTQGLKMHTEVVHGDRERRFQCEFCEMNYLARKHLTRHRRSVHKDKVGERGEEERLKFTTAEYRPDFIGPREMFPCEGCGKVFPLRSRMRKHLKEYCKVAREGGGMEGMVG